MFCHRPTETAKRGRWDAMHSTVVQANPQFGVIVGGELGTDVNFISEIVGLRGERHETKSANLRSGVEPLVWG